MLFLAIKGFLARLRLRTGFVCVLLLLGLTVQASEKPLSDLSREDKLKAAYLFHFTRFVRWSDFGLTEGQSVRLCVDSTRAFAEFINEMSHRAQNRGSPNRTVEVVLLPQADTQEICHIVYVRQPGLYAGFRAEALVVGDLNGPYSGLATVLFYPDKQRLRFQIHVERLEASGIPVSSELLKLAKLVP